MPYSAAAIANYFLDLAKVDGKSLNAMKIGKLVYFAHGWHLALAGEPLIDEYVEAWRWGPMIPSLYHVFKHFGNGPITERVGESIPLSFPLSYSLSLPDDGSIKSLLNKVWEIYGVLSAIQLSNLTHLPESPWVEAWENCEMPKGCDMDNGLIRKYFESLVVGQQVDCIGS